jgi:hypothetical protein
MDYDKMAEEHCFSGSLSGLVGELRSNAVLATAHFATAKHDSNLHAADKAIYTDHGGQRGDRNADGHGSSVTYPGNHGIYYYES